MNTTCIFPPGEAFVIDLPTNFNLVQQLKNAKTIRLATAFARKSGWNLIEKGIRESKAKMNLLTGLDFNSTEPEMLSKWYELVLKGQTSAKLFSKRGTNFHPKVIIVEGEGIAFGIIGSGNLSAGGFQDNVECSIYTEDSKILQNLIGWYDGLFNDPTITIDLAPEIIEEYKKIWKQEFKSIKRLKKKEHLAIERIQNVYKSHMALRQGAIVKAKKFINTDRFEKWYQDHMAKAEQIKKYLDYPQFEFDKNGLDEFFKIGNLGHLIAIRKPSIWKNRLKVGRILRFLVDETRPIGERIDAIQGKNANKFYSDGLGMNILTKILAVHRPKVYPVINAPVRMALKFYKYHQSKGVSIGTKYGQLSRFMKDFIRDSGLPDMLALDVFLYWIGENKTKTNS